MIRSALVIAAALRLAAPHLSEPAVASYVPILRAEAIEHHCDPLTLIAMVKNESRWRAGMVGGMDRQCIGLGQVCLHNYPTCRDSAFSSPACRSKKAALLSGSYNLRVTASLITANRRFCWARTGRPALFARWLSSYQGWNNRPQSGRQGVWCNMRQNTRGKWVEVRAPAMTRRVMAYRRSLIRQLGL